MSTIRILVADDHAFVRMGIAALLSSETDMEIVGNARNGKEAVDAALKLNPDVAIIDLMMPRKDGVTATREILAARPQVKVVIITSFLSADGAAHALEAGAVGLVSKDADNTALVRAIRRAVEGKKTVPPGFLQQMSADPPVPQLSPRQLEVLQSLTKGLSNTDIAKQLGVSRVRVEELVSQILTKIGAANRTEAVVLAIRKQLLKI